MTEEWIYNNCTALHLAAVLGHLEAVKLLVDPKLVTISNDQYFNVHLVYVWLCGSSLNSACR